MKYKHRRWEHVPLENVNNANFCLKLPPFTPFPAPTSATPAPPCPDNVTLGGARLREMSADGGQLQYFMFYLQSLTFFITFKAYLQDTATDKGPGHGPGRHIFQRSVWSAWSLTFHTSSACCNLLKRIQGQFILRILQFNPYKHSET